MAHSGHARTQKNRRNVQSCLREILDASFWRKQHQQFIQFEQNRTRWTLPMCLHAGLWMALDSARPVTERFENAREILTATFPKRRRCGTTFSGYTQALADLPLELFDAMRDQMQRIAEQQQLRLAQMGRWQAYGIDGSNENLPRTQAHEEHYGIVTKGPGTAERLVVTAVAMRRNVLWDWAADSALGSERKLALDLIRRLPLGALAVLDAGFIGYEWGTGVQASGHHFLARVGGNLQVWIESLPNAQWREGEVWLWPELKREGPPLVLRLIKLTVPRKKKNSPSEDLWLVTDILESERLTRAEAAEFYRKRWSASECTFRSWKQTLQGKKLASRTPQQAEPEADLSLCALMLLQLSVCLARRQVRFDRRKISVAQAQRVWRRAGRALAKGRQTAGMKKKLSACVCDTYRRRKPKVRRRWPERKEPRRLKSPIFRKLIKRLKVSGLLRLEEQKRATA